MQVPLEVAIGELRSASGCALTPAMKRIVEAIASAIDTDQVTPAEFVAVLLGGVCGQFTGALEYEMEDFGSALRVHMIDEMERFARAWSHRN